MLLTIILAVVMMAGLFLMLWGAVGFVQNKKFFSSAPKEALKVIQSKEERIKGQHICRYAVPPDGANTGRSGGSEQPCHRACRQ